MRLPVMYLLITVAILTVSAAQAEKLYKWIGKDGKISYQDRPPPENAGTVQEKDLTTRAGTAADAADGSIAAQKFPVVLYMVPKCSSCDMARAYLKKRHIPFAEKNVDNNQPLQKEMKEKVGDLSVPTITVGGKIMKGYLESLLEGELDQAGYPKTVSKEKEPAAEEEGAAPQQ